MDEQSNPQQPESEMTHGHEMTDADPYALGMFGGALALMIAVVLSVLGLVFGWFEAASERSDHSASAVTVPSRLPGPRLQSRPAVDLASLRDDEHRRMSQYEWIDRKRGIVRIPIERAMAVLAEQGLPEPKQIVLPTNQKDATP